MAIDPKRIEQVLQDLKTPLPELTPQQATDLGGRFLSHSLKITHARAELIEVLLGVHQQGLALDRQILDAGGGPTGAGFPAHGLPPRLARALETYLQELRDQGLAAPPE